MNGGRAALVNPGSRLPDLLLPAAPDGTPQPLSGALRLDPPALAIADQWGEVHAGVAAGAEHRWLAVAEVADWLRYLAMQCPECEGEAL